MRLNVLTNLAVTAILVFSLNACKEKGTIVSESTYSIPTTLGGYSLDQVLRKYDLSSVDGYITLAQQERDGMSKSSTGEINVYNGIEYVAEAVMMDNSGAKLDAGAILINGMQLEKLELGHFLSFATKPLSVSFGSSMNRVIIEAGANVPRHQDSVNFAEASIITNLSRGQKLRADTGFIVTWNNSTSGSWYEVDMTTYFKDATSAEEMAKDSTRLKSIRRYFSSTNSVTMPDPRTLGFKSYRTGLADIRVTKYEPIFKTMSNGRKICLLGISSSTRTVIFE
jgi:hypothetical protein